MIERLYEAYLSSSGVSTDTRNIQKNCIFFALKGANFNGNHFAQEALNQGAMLAVIDEPDFATDGTLLVSNVLETLQVLGRYHREKLSIPVIGLTGSNGKTTTKELLAAVLRTKYNVFATHGNLNNHIGVPLSLLSITEDHELAIIEMGANHQKEIDFLSHLALPDSGMITNIGKAHLEGFGGPEGVLKGKKELYDYLEKSQGTVFLNLDDPVLKNLCPDTETVPYGGDSNVSGNIIDDTSLLQLLLQIDDRKEEIQTNLVGGYNLQNILAAACIGNYYSIPFDKIKSGLEDYQPSNNRSEFKETGRNKLILDAYNANPSSVEAALRNFAKRPEQNKLAIIGDMLELGTDSAAEHANIIQLIQDLSLDAILIGPEFQKIPAKFPCYDDSDAALEAIEQSAYTDYTILIKGSRGIRLEKLVPAL